MRRDDRITTLLLGTAILLGGSTGCTGTSHSHRAVTPPGCDPVYSQYHHDAFRWSDVGRVLVLPIANESSYTKADEELARALRAELQQLGKFEVVAAPPDELARMSERIHRGGRFDEDQILQLGRAFNADVVIHATITQYSPYPRPRLGIVVQAVAPAEGKVIGSVDGLWDANHLPIAKRAQNYYTQRKHERGPYLDANWIWPDDGHADELTLLSPQLYQRWVCSEIAAILVQDPASEGVIFAPTGVKAVTPRKRYAPIVVPGPPTQLQAPAPVNGANGKKETPKDSPKEPPTAMPKAQGEPEVEG
jgi:hypothetical protein